MSVAQSPLQSLSAALSATVAGAAKSVVCVHSHRSRSSGFAWREGLIVTAEEPLAEEGDIAVALPAGETVAATLVGRDPTTDIALLRVDRSDLAPATLTSVELQPGALALAVGAEEGRAIAAFGIVSAAGPAWRSMRGGTVDARIELDLSLRRHAEGGLALDAEGRAFGMAVFGARKRVLVIPAATIERVATALLQHGRVARGYLGLGLQPVKLEGEALGAMVMSVDSEGPGAAAGFKQGDVIVAWDGAPIEGMRGLLRGLGPDSVGKTVRLSMQRAGEPLELALTIAARPEA
jgi:S1-C subfamily serine protease